MWPVFVLVLVASASAQIPSLGWCPDYQPMANFNMNRFLGTWYEAERYFTVSELISRCITTNYVSTPEGRILVSNEFTNTITGVKRVMEGSLQKIGREGEGRILAKYTSMPIPYDYEYSILDTDYDNYAVMWSCSGLGPVHTQSAWILTRDRLAPPSVMQNAYAVLDRFKMSRAFFVKTSQADCTVLPDPAASPTAGKSNDKVEVEKVEEPRNEKVEEPVVLNLKASDPETKLEIPLENLQSAELKPQEAKPKGINEIIMPEKKDKKDDDKGEAKKPEQEKMEMPEKEEKLKTSELEQPVLS